MKRKILLIVLSLAALAVLYLLFWPVPVDTEAWQPPVAPPLKGVYESNSRLATAERFAAGGHAPEGVAIDAEGRVYTGLEDGRVVRFQPDGRGPENFADTKGRPLGLQFDRDGNLIVADAYKGLLSVSRDGAVSVLSNEAGGRRIGCPNDLDIASDGTIYFTDATGKFPISVYKYDIIEHRPNGRFLAYDPATKQTRVLIDDIHFANGVALGPGEEFVLVVETGEYKVWRLWLKGARAGEREIFIDNLPGFPDNVTFNGRDTFWLALVTPRNALLDRLFPHPFLRKIVLRLPSFLQPAPEKFGFVLGLSPEGRVTQNLQDPTGQHYYSISSALERDGVLYLGSLSEDAAGRLKLSDATR
jgi:sugar lactone lactonase YvrE